MDTRVRTDVCPESSPLGRGGIPGEPAASGTWGPLTLFRLRGRGWGQALVGGKHTVYKHRVAVARSCDSEPEWRLQFKLFTQHNILSRKQAGEAWGQAFVPVSCSLLT